MPGYDPNCGLLTTQAGATVSANPTPFRELSDFVALPRVGALRLAPDGSWLAAAVQTLSPDQKKYLTSIWRIDAQGGPARRLTRSAEGEGGPRFLPDGSLLFTSRRPDPAGRRATTATRATARRCGCCPRAAARPAWWPRCPAASPPPRRPGTRPPSWSARRCCPGRPRNGQRERTARRTGANGPGTDAAGQDARLRQERKDAGITAILHESAPVRFWDHDLGPDQPRLFALDLDAEDQVTASRRSGRRSGRTGGVLARAARPDSGAGAGAGRRGVRADAGRRVGRHRLVAMAPGGRVALRAGPHRHGQRQAAGAAVRARVRLRGPAGLARRAVRRLPARAARHRRAAGGHTAVVLDVDGAGEPGESGRDLLPGFDRWPGTWPGRTIPARCTSPPTTAAAARCSGWTSRPAASPG